MHTILGVMANYWGAVHHSVVLVLQTHRLPA